MSLSSDGGCPVVEQGAIAAGRCALSFTHAVIGSFATFLSGCSSAPSRNILGSYFPSWMICALIGMGLTIVVRCALLARPGIEERIAGSDRGLPGVRDGLFTRHLASMAGLGGATR